jgi:hypothetical protein
VPGKNARPSRTKVRGKGWTRSRSIASDKYQVISRAILATLPKTPITYTEVVRRVEAKAKRFAGSISWYTITCLRELEMQGKVTRHRNPVRYSRVK